jgi:hypothetical protein
MDITAGVGSNAGRNQRRHSFENINIVVLQRGAPLSNRFNLGTLQDNAGLKSFQDFKIMKSAAIADYLFICHRVLCQKYQRYCISFKAKTQGRT